MEIAPRSRLPRLPAWLWAAAAVVLAALPLAPGFTGSRIFYIRDLSLYFWGRYLWLRRAWLSGEFPLWDPYVGGGQAAVADALHQMFLLPAVLIRLIGSEVIGFNLWVAAPFPLAALGGWLFLRRRYSPAASTLGAATFALCGPIYATSNFPNMSWTVAAIPWILWAVDRLVDRPGPRNLATLIVLVACQGLAGEPVTFLSTLALTAAFAVLLAGREELSAGDRLRRSAWPAAGLVAGFALAAVQLIPMAQAAAQSQRNDALRNGLFWSLHPVALLETISPHLFGDYYVSQSLASIPWVPILNSGREPFLFSLYFGVPVLALALIGFIAGGSKRWTAFWMSAVVVSLVGAFGGYTPVYPFLRDHLPLLASFRFPAKYIVIAALAIAVEAAAGWDLILRPRTEALLSKIDWARAWAVGFALAITLVTALAAAACLYLATPTAFRLYDIAQRMYSGNPVGAAEFMLQSLPRHASLVMLLALVTALLLQTILGGRTDVRLARMAFGALVVGDLLVRAWPVNPTFDAAYMREPEWLAMTKADPNARFYVGGKRDGTLDATDVHASKGFLNPPGLIGSASRAALSGQTAFYPSAWHGRELMSYDLAVLWPTTFGKASGKFFGFSSLPSRERFLNRTGVRFRVLPATQSGGRDPLVQVPYYVHCYLYDWGPEVTPRASVLPRASIVRHAEHQISALFDPQWDPEAVLITHHLPPAGQAAAPVDPFARIVSDTPNRMVIEAGAGADGGYLLLLDSYDSNWQARVDGQPVEVVRANGLFRAVHVAPGRHEVEYAYRPAGLFWGATTSAGGLVLVLLLIAWPARRARAVAAAPADAGTGGSPAPLTGAFAQD